MSDALIYHLTNLALEVSAGDSALIGGVPREWREEALMWQADLSDADLLAMLEEAWEGRIGHDSLWDEFRAVAADRHAESWLTEQRRRENEALDSAIALSGRVAECAQAVEAALAIELRQAAGGSWYGRFRGLKIRVSDHAQVSGGGWSEDRQERMGEADVQFVAASTEAEIPGRAEIRSRVAGLLWEAR